MAFPDRIERVVEVTHPPRKVWAAVTTAEGLGTWFGNRATVDGREGGVINLSWDSGDTAELRIERLDEPFLFAFTWDIHGLDADDPRRTYVEFTLEAIDGGTRLKVVESGFAQLAQETFDKAYGGNVEGWGKELGELVAYLDAA